MSQRPAVAWQGHGVDPQPAPTTRERLLDLAAEVFAEEGYGAVSVRDLARRSSLTTGAIYAHFLNKAELLVEAIDARVATDVETSRDRTDLNFVDYLTDLNRRYRSEATCGPCSSKAPPPHATTLRSESD